MVPRVLVAGGGVVGYEVARRLERHGQDLDVVLVDRDGMHVYQPLLPEVAAGVIEPRHAVVPLRAGLTRTRILLGELTGLDPDRRRAEVCKRDGCPAVLEYDHCVVALGGVTHVPPVPGLVDHALGFTTVAESLALRDRVLERLELAAVADDPARRRRALTFVVVGAGYSGVEAIGELQSLAADACRVFPEVRPQDLRWLLVEAGSEILSPVRPSLRAHALAQLRARGIDVRLESLVQEVADGTIHFSDGSRVDSDTLVWCAGIRPHPRVATLGLEIDDGFLVVDAQLRTSADGVWAAGDCARVPDLVRGGACPPSAQYALRQARVLARNLVRATTAAPPRTFRYRRKGEMLTLGRFAGVGEILGVPVRGFAAWTLRHWYHVLRIPTWSRKLRVWWDWTTNLAFPREVVSLGSARRPRDPITQAARAVEPR